MAREQKAFPSRRGNWGQVNILNAVGRPPTSATVTTGSGSVTGTDLWREEGTVSTVNSDQNVPGNYRVKVDTVHPCAFVQTTVNEMHLRFNLGGLDSSARVSLKKDNGAFDVISSTVPVGASPILSEIYLQPGVWPTNVQDYIDSSGNITVRIEVYGQVGNQYTATFDQVLVRCLRASETE